MYKYKLISEASEVIAWFGPWSSAGPWSTANLLSAAGPWPARAAGPYV